MQSRSNPIQVRKCKVDQMSRNPPKVDHGQSNLSVPIDHFTYTAPSRTNLVETPTLNKEIRREKMKKKSCMDTMAGWAVDNKFQATYSFSLHDSPSAIRRVKGFLVNLLFFFGLICFVRYYLFVFLKLFEWVRCFHAGLYFSRFSFFTCFNFGNFHWYSWQFKYSK